MKEGAGMVVVIFFLTLIFLNVIACFVLEGIKVAHYGPWGEVEISALTKYMVHLYGINVGLIAMFTVILSLVCSEGVIL